MQEITPEDIQTTAALTAANSNTQPEGEAQKIPDVTSKPDEPSALQGLMANRDKILAEKKALKAEVEALRQAFSGLTPDQIAAALEEISTLRQQIDDLKAQNALLSEQISLTQFRQRLEKMALEAGAKPQAAEDIFERARKFIWRETSNENYQALDRKSETEVLAPDGSPLTLSVWIKGLPERAEHLFGASVGGGVQQAQTLLHHKGKPVNAPYSLDDVASGRVHLLP